MSPRPTKSICLPVFMSYEYLSLWIQRERNGLVCYILCTRRECLGFSERIMSNTKNSSDTTSLCQEHHIVSKAKLCFSSLFALTIQIDDLLPIVTYKWHIRVVITFPLHNMLAWQCFLVIIESGNKLALDGWLTTACNVIYKAYIACGHRCK